MGPLPELLSQRERDVLQLLVRGFTNREVAEQLHISVRTAEWHRASIRRKLGLASRAGLVDFAFAHGLVQLGQGPTRDTGESTSVSVRDAPPLDRSPAAVRVGPGKTGQGAR